jgi:hypothetical protein
MELVRGRGGKVVGSHRVLGEKAEDGTYPEIDTMVVVRSEGGDVPVSLGLLARMSVYATFRQRSHELVLALRARGAQYAKEIGLAPEYTALVLPGSVTLAHLVGRNEQRAWDLLGGVHGLESEDASAGFASGVVPGVGVVWPAILLTFGGWLAWATYRLWIGERAAWWWDGVGLLGWVERVPERGFLAWRASRRITAPFGLTIERGPPATLIALWALWVLAGLVTVGWALWPRHARARSGLLGRPGRSLARGGK